MSDTNTKTGGTSMYAVVCIVLTILKAFNIIDLSWKLIICLWLAPFAVVFLALIICLVILFLAALFN